MSAQPAVPPAAMTLRQWRQDTLDRVGGGERFAGMFATATAASVRLTTMLAGASGIDLLDHELPAGAGGYPALSGTLPAAAWYEREIHDLFGVVPLDHPRLDPLVLPLAAGEQSRPRPGSGDVVPTLTPDERAVPSRVLGHGIFTIPHGPVRSGVTESVEYLVETPGEDIPHVGIRVFAKHRGVERRFEGMPAATAVLLAERVEGIASVAHALAYSHAIEAVAGAVVPRRAALVRVLYAEIERVANHLDVALKLCDAAGLAVAASRMALHKENVLRLVGAMSGSRFGRGVVVPGGVTALPALAPEQLRARLGELERAVRADVRPLMLTPSFLDRLRDTGPLDARVARSHGALGPVGRASGYDDDDRRARPYDAYAGLDVPAGGVEPAGDAMARLRVRWAEVWTSFALAHQVVDELASSSTDAAGLRVDLPVASGRGVGWAEAPQGEVVYVAELDAGLIRRCKPRSASFHNLLLFHDVFAGDILTDFPFIEASFGLSIAGVAG